jgi:RNA polymerase sigma-70 factor (ECF subfamily)
MSQLACPQTEPALEAMAVPSESVRARYLALLESYAPAIRRTARLYERDPGLREDLVQDTCLALWQALPRFRGECSERTFVFRVAHNRGATHAWRRRKRAMAPLDDVYEPQDVAPSPEAAAVASRRSDDLTRAVADLPITLRQAVTLMLEGLTPREIGDVLGITENNANVRLARARQALRERMLESRT